MRLNRLGDEGGALLLEGLKTNTSLQLLNMSANSVAGVGTKALCNILRNPSSMLMAVDMSCNELGQAEADDMAGALRENATLTSLDLRSNEGLKAVTPVVDDIQSIVRQNELESRSYTRK